MNHGPNTTSRDAAEIPDAREDEMLDAASEASMDASDPPSYTGAVAGAGRKESASTRRPVAPRRHDDSDSRIDEPLPDWADWTLRAVALGGGAMLAVQGLRRGGISGAVAMSLGAAIAMAGAAPSAAARSIGREPGRLAREARRRLKQSFEAAADARTIVDEDRNLGRPSPLHGAAE